MKAQSGSNRFLWLGAATAALAAFITGCGNTVYPMDTLSPKSDLGYEVT